MASLALPAPSPARPGSLEDALQRRRSWRAFAPSPLALADLAQLLWAAQGRSDAEGHHTAPSAGALYPLELFVVTARVDGLAPGVYRYESDGHVLRHAARAPGHDALAALAAATRGQGWVAQAPALLVITAELRRSARRYGELAGRFVDMEAGAVAQNVHLQATARAQATVLIGSFDEGRVRKALALPDDLTPLALMPLGHPR